MARFTKDQIDAFKKAVTEYNNSHSSRLERFTDHTKNEQRDEITHIYGDIASCINKINRDSYFTTTSELKSAIAAIELSTELNKFFTDNENWSDKQTQDLENLDMACKSLQQSPKEQLRQLGNTLWNSMIGIIRLMKFVIKGIPAKVLDVINPDKEITLDPHTADAKLTTRTEAVYDQTIGNTYAKTDLQKAREKIQFFKDKHVKLDDQVFKFAKSAAF